MIRIVLKHQTTTTMHWHKKLVGIDYKSFREKKEKREEVNSI